MVLIHRLFGLFGPQLWQRETYVDLLQSFNWGMWHDPQASSFLKIVEVLYFNSSIYIFNIYLYFKVLLYNIGDLKKFYSMIPAPQIELFWNRQALLSNHRGGYDSPATLLSRIRFSENLKTILYIINI